MSDTETNTSLLKTDSQDNLVANESLPEDDFSMYKVDETTSLIAFNTEKTILPPPLYQLKNNNQTRDTHAAPEDKPRAIINKTVTVEPSLFLTLCAVAFQTITSTTLTIDKVCHVTYNFSDSICSNFTHYPDASDKIQSYSADLGMYYRLIETIPPVLYSFFLGSWSDKHSRKFPIVFPILGFICSTICNLFFVYYMETPPEYLMISSVFVGLTGGLVSTYLGVFSYVVDVTSQENRTVRIAFTELALYVSIPLGIALSSVIFGEWSYMPVYLTSLAFLLASLIYTIFFVPETIQFESYGDRSKVFRDMFDLDNVRSNFETITTKRTGNYRIYINLLTFCMFILLFPQLGEGVVALLFVETKFGWDQSALGYFTTYSSAISVIGTGLLYRFVLKKYHLSDLVLGGLGIIAIIIKDVIISMSSAGWMLYMAASVSFFQFLSEPTVRSFLTKLVSKDEVGKLFAVISSCESLSPIFSSIAYSQLYKAFKDDHPGAVYVLSTGLAIIPLIIFIWIIIDKRKFDRDKQLEDTAEQIN